MTTSNVTEYESTGAEIVGEALKIIRVSQANQPLKANDMSSGITSLNGLVKSWQRDGLHLWKDQEAAVFLSTGRRTYGIGSPPALGCDTACKADETFADTIYSTKGDWVYTATTAAILAGVDVIPVASLISYAGIEYNMTCAMLIGIENTAGLLDWYGITSNTGLDITINIPLVADVAEGATVYIYREADQLDKPLRLYQENVRLFQLSSSYELPINLLAWTDYNLLPQKHTVGIPVQISYNPNINGGEVAIWPTAESVQNVLLFRYQAGFDIFDSDTDTQDFPAEWIRPLTWALAAELGPQYGVPLQRQMALEQKAGALKEEVQAWDQDTSSLYLMPRLMGYN
jgi:hypothetical protein